MAAARTHWPMRDWAMEESRETASSIFFSVREVVWDGVILARARAQARQCSALFAVALRALP